MQIELERVLVGRGSAGHLLLLSLSYEKYGGYIA